MNLKGKIFEDRNGSLHTVEDVNDTIAILDTGQRVAVERLFDTNYYTEQINNNVFEEKENNFYKSLSNQLKNISTENLSDIPQRQNVSINQPVVESHREHTNTMKNKKPVQNTSDIEQRKREMAQKAKNINMEVESNNREFEKYVSDSDLDDDEKVPVNRNLENVKYDNDRDTSVTMYNENEEIVGQVKPSKKKVQMEDPMYQMFKNVKRTTKFALNMKVDQKIPRKDFIKMWEENYEKSIIEYLAVEITEELLKDPKELKKYIYDSLYDHVYGKAKKTKKSTKKTTKKNDK